jgi:hypothetical protein
VGNGQTVSDSQAIGKMAIWTGGVVSVGMKNALRLVLGDGLYSKLFLLNDL